MTSRFFIARLVSLAVLFASAICVSAGPPQAGQEVRREHAMGTRLMAKGLPNFGAVSANLYRGALPSKEGFAELKKLGVNVVVDMRGKDKGEEAAVKKLGMQYIPIPSHCPFPKDDTFAKFLRVIRENPGKKVFVHCRLGDDRTGMAVASYRMSEEGWSADEAMKEMKAFGFSAVHHAICPGMADYEENFPQRLRTSAAFKELRGANETHK